MKSRTKHLLVPLLIIACVMSASSFDRHRSRLWTNLASGRHQRLVLNGTSLSTVAYSYWPDTLQTRLNAIFGAGLLDLRNLSPDGGNTSMAGPNCADSIHQITDLAPDAVFIEFASNDATNHYDCTVEACSRPSHVKFIESIHRLLPSCEIFLYITGLPWDKQSCGSVACAYCTVFEAQYCRRAARPSSNDHVEKYFDMVREEAERYSTHLIDTYDDFKKVHDSAFASYVNYLYDGHHPTPQAVHEIIMPRMLRALKGWPIVITAPKAGDKLRVGDSVRVSWEYDPDSVGTVDVEVSPDSGITWLPALKKSVTAADTHAVFLLPPQIGGYALTTDRFMVRVRKYDSNLADVAGPMTVTGGNRATERRMSRPVGHVRAASSMIVSARDGRLVIFNRDRGFDCHGMLRRSRAASQ